MRKLASLPVTAAITAAPALANSQFSRQDRAQVRLDKAVEGRVARKPVD
jgi:hypothetical protein